MEIWKNIEDYEKYQVSSLGRVRTTRGNGKILSLKKKNRQGYVIIALRKDGKNFYKRVHRLVAQAFIPNPDNKPDIDHINTDKTDNRVENLRWATRKENMNNPITRQLISTKTQGRIPWNKGIPCSASTKLKSSITQKGRKYPEKQKPIIQSIMGIYVKRWDCMRDINSELNFSCGNICTACKKNKKAYGFEWTYAS